MDELEIVKIFAICELIVLIPIIIFMSIVMWKLFEKAEYAGWKALIPIYSSYILTCKIAGKDNTTFILHFIPIVNIYAKIITGIALAKSFGKDDGYGIGLAFLAIVFYPMLAFSKKTNYIGPLGISLEKDSRNSLTTNWQTPNKPTDI